MDIPTNLKLKNTMHGSGAKGMAIYGYADANGLGVRMEAKRKDGRSSFVETWFLDALPNREFASFKALQEAAMPLSDADVSAVAAQYPQIAEAAKDPCGNACRLCPRSGSLLNRAGEREKHDTMRVTLAYSWKERHSLSLCDAHFGQFNGDPKGLRDAVEADNAARRARRAEFLAASEERRASGAQPGEGNG